MNLLLDTHVLLWFLLNDERLRLRHITMLRDTQNAIHVSAVTGFEIATKVRIGKLPAAMAARDLTALCKDSGYVELSLSLRHAMIAGQLPGDHRDPFDRLLAAQSIAEGITLMSGDPAFRTLGISVAW